MQCGIVNTAALLRIIKLKRVNTSEQKRSIGLKICRTCLRSKWTDFNSSPARLRRCCTRSKSKKSSILTDSWSKTNNRLKTSVYKWINWEKTFNFLKHVCKSTLSLEARMFVFMMHSTWLLTFSKIKVLISFQRWVWTLKNFHRLNL